MAFERNTTDGIRTWLNSELSAPGWSSSSIAKSLTEDVMYIIVDHFHQFETKIRQAIILSVVYMKKNDFLSLGEGLNKVLQMALNDKDDFVRTTATILRHYPESQSFDLNIDTWSTDFRSLLGNIGASIKSNGFNFHPLEDMILQPGARTTPPHVSTNYATFNSTHKPHFKLTTNKADIISSGDRHMRFKELVDTEDRAQQQEAQQAQFVAQKRAGAELQSKSKRIVSPTHAAPNPFTYPLPPRSNSLSSIPAAAAASLYTKRPARPTPAGGAGAGGGLFIQKPKPVQRTGLHSRPGGGIQKSTPTSQLPRGLQRAQKTQMLDFNAATEFQQNINDQHKKAQEEIEAKARARKAEAEAKKAEAEAKKAERLEKIQKKEEAKRLRLEAQAQAKAGLPTSPTSAPGSPETPTSPNSPTIKTEHVFAIPALPGHYQQGQRQPDKRTPPTEKLTTF